MEHKKEKKKYNNYKYLDEDIIQKACMGEGVEQCAVIARYMNYANKCFRTIASKVFGLSPDGIPMEDIMQVVWMKYIRIITMEFTNF